MSNCVLVARKILKQMRHDKRTIGLILIAPLVISTLLYFIFKDLPTFESIGVSFLGIIVYFLVFLLSGITLLNERTSGILERVLTTSIRRSQIVVGYIMGFGLLAVIQALLLSVYYIYILGADLAGDYWTMLLILLLSAFNALTLGMLLSTLAGSEFQMVQFIPIIIIPQILLCGMFPLSDGWENLSYFMPMYYSVDALNEIVVDGCKISDIWLNLGVMFGLTVVFAILNAAVLKRERKL